MRITDMITRKNANGNTVFLLKDFIVCVIISKLEFFTNVTKRVHSSNNPSLKCLKLL